MSIIRLFNLVHQLGIESSPLFEPLLAMKRLWNNLACEPIPSAEDEACGDSPKHDFPCPMAELMDQFDGFDCADPRDRIYALSSLQSCAKITPDYGKTTEEVYIDFATITCSHRQLKWILDAVSHRHNGSIAPGLPSWVPDWRSRRLRNPLVANDTPYYWKIIDGLKYLYIGQCAIALEVPTDFKSPDIFMKIELLPAPILSKGDPFPADPTKEYVHRWIKGIRRFLSAIHSRLELFHNRTSMEILLRRFVEPFSLSELRNTFPEPSCKFSQDLVSSKVYDADSRFLYESLVQAG